MLERSLGSFEELLVELVRDEFRIATSLDHRRKRALLRGISAEPEHGEEQVDDDIVCGQSPQSVNQ